MPQVFRILSIDGGGIRGVFPAHILACMEERLKVNILDSFDLIAGTSTGSIIAAGVALGMSPARIVAMYKEDGEQIFAAAGLPWMRMPLVASRYSSKHLAKVLHRVFQDARMGEIKKPLLIPATDIGNGTVHVIKSGYSNEFTRDPQVLVRDAVLASCSAPTYFDPMRLDEYLLADGGLWANNPVLAAVIEAKKRLGILLGDIRVLSIGTGHSKVNYRTRAKRKWGLVTGWKSKRFIDFIMSLQSQSAENFLGLLLEPTQVVRINFSSDQKLPLDDCSTLDDLISRADQTFTHKSRAIEEFLRR